MDIRIELDYGPITAEIQSDADESYDEVLSELATFIEDHDEIFGDVEIGHDGHSDGARSGDDGGDGRDIEVEDRGWATLVEETETSEEKLQHLFEIGESYPQLLIGEHITGSNNDQMEEGALLLLAVWEHYYGNENMTTTEIKDCLRNAGLPHQNFANVYQRQSFNQYFVKNQVDREDGGTTSEISLTQPGRNQAYRLISELSDSIDN